MDPDDAALILEFSEPRDVLAGATLSAHGGAPLYAVSTDARGGTSTVRRVDADAGDSEGAPLAVITRRTAQIALRGRPPVRLGRWLKTGGLGALPARFVEEGVKYTWRTNDEGQLSLWTGDTQIAWYTRRPAARLALRDAAVGVQDAVVLSCLVLVQRGTGEGPGGAGEGTVRRRLLRAVSDSVLGRRYLSQSESGI